MTKRTATFRLFSLGYIVVIGGLNLIMAGCGKSSPSATGSTSPYSCNVTTGLAASCTDYLGANYTASAAESANQSICSSESGTFALASCPTVNRVGSCHFGEGAGDDLIIRYYSTNSSTPDSSTAQSTCASTTINSQNGVFSAN